jgi:hypothetical protein
MAAGLTTNAHDPALIITLSDKGLLDTASAFRLARATGRPWRLTPGDVNLLLLHDTLPELLRQVNAALRCGATIYCCWATQGADLTLRPTTDELASAFTLLTGLGHTTGATMLPTTTPGGGSP